MTYVVHSSESAPADAKEILSAVKKGFGFVPNMLGMMAEAPTLLNAYRTVAGIFDQTSLTPAERQTVLLTVSYENNCEYCMAAHSTIAGMQNVPQAIVAALRSGAPIADKRLEALRRFTSAVVTSKGHPSNRDLEVFAQAGYGPQQVLEVVLGVGLKTLSNYANHIAATPLDPAFAPAAWTKAA